VRVLLRKVILALAAAAMLATAAGVMVIAAGIAVFALFRPWLGPAGAAAAVALAAANAMAVIGLVLDRCILRSRQRRPEDEQDLLQKLIGLAQDKPIIAVGALIGAVFLAIRNPALTAVVVKAFLDPKPRPGKKA
jgi:hypothetical protein